VAHWRVPVTPTIPGISVATVNVVSVGIVYLIYGRTPEVRAVWVSVRAVVAVGPVIVNAPVIPTAPVPMVTAPVDVLKVPLPPDQSFAVAPDAVMPPANVTDPLKIDVPAKTSIAYLFVPTCDPATEGALSIKRVANAVTVPREAFVKVGVPI